jgi:hypothetical protein
MAAIAPRQNSVRSCYLSNTQFATRVSSAGIAGRIFRSVYERRLPWRWLLRFAIGVLLFTLPARTASLRTETLDAWRNYVNAASSRMYDQTKPGKGFLSIDDLPEGAIKVRQGEIVVSAIGPDMPKSIPSGLIHHWTGAAFIPAAKLDDVLPVVRDYQRYKDIYHPSVVQSRALGKSGVEDRFSLLLSNSSLFQKTAYDIDYKSAPLRVNETCWFTISQTTRVQEIQGYGEEGQHLLPENQGTGLIWRLFGVTRLQERDGGVYIEIEAIALSRDIPFSLRWLVQPVIRRVARSAIVSSLQKTRDAVISQSDRTNRAAASRPAQEGTEYSGSY